MLAAACRRAPRHRHVRGDDLIDDESMAFLVFVHPAVTVTMQCAHARGRPDESIPSLVRPHAPDLCGRRSREATDLVGRLRASPGRHGAGRWPGSAPAGRGAAPAVRAKRPCIQKARPTWRKLRRRHAARDLIPPRPARGHLHGSHRLTGGVCDERPAPVRDES